MTEPAREPLRVVVADDEADVILMLRTTLRMEPRLEVVAEAVDGPSAVEACAEHHPDVVLLDYYMPKLSADEAIAGIKAASPETRVVVFSASATFKDAERAGADGYIRKGTALRQLIDQVVAHADSRSSGRA